MSVYSVGRAVCKAFLKVAYSVKVVGLENIPKDRNFILCSNHRSYVDPVFLAVKLKQPLTFMAKKELFEKPVLGVLIKALGAFPVSRGKGDTGAVDKAISSINEGKVLAIFPEGTRSKTGKLLRFKSGSALIAHKTGVDIIPACICYEGKLGFRKRVVVRYGESISNEQLNITETSSTELKEASKLLQSAVQKLFDEGTDI